jgi:hypothetical protein
MLAVVLRVIQREGTFQMLASAAEVGLYKKAILQNMMGFERQRWRVGLLRKVQQLESKIVGFTEFSTHSVKGLQASVVDQFAQPKLYDIKKPTRLCTPAAEDGQARKDAGRHLMCYQVRPARKEPRHSPVLGIFLNNHIGPEQVDTVKDEELCVPSLKILP